MFFLWVSIFSNAYLSLYIQETADHLLYPNPGSGLIHEQHLQYFNFLGTVLAKVFTLLSSIIMPFFITREKVHFLMLLFLFILKMKIFTSIVETCMKTHFLFVVVLI